jgi:hypothetical protein
MATQAMATGLGANVLAWAHRAAQGLAVSPPARLRTKHRLMAHGEQLDVRVQRMAWETLVGGEAAEPG